MPLSILHFLPGVSAPAQPHSTLWVKATSTWHLPPIAGSGSPSTCTRCIVVPESPRKTRCSQEPGGKLCSRRGEISKSSLSSGLWSPVTSGSLLAANAGDELAHGPLVTKQRDPVPSPQGDGSNGVGQEPYAPPMKHNKGAKGESATWMDIPTQGRALHLLGRKYFWPKAHSREAKRGSKYHTHEAALPNRNI